MDTLTPLYSIGHGTHREERFLALLKAHEVEVLLDVRSSPASQRAPHFHRSLMKEWLARRGITYSYGGRFLGGRPKDSALYVNGQVSYERMTTYPPFMASLRRLLRGTRQRRVAIMCAEVDPIECHRFLLIGRDLHRQSIPVFHILGDGSLESQSEGEARLLALLGRSQPDLFDSGAASVEDAYLSQIERVAYRLRSPLGIQAPRSSDV